MSEVENNGQFALSEKDTDLTGEVARQFGTWIERADSIALQRALIEQEKRWCSVESLSRTALEAQGEAA